MARAALLVAVAAVMAAALVFAASADGDQNPASSSGAPAITSVARGMPAGPELLLPRGATFSWVTAEAPRIPRQIGAVAVAGLDVALGRRSDGAPVTGDAPADRPPPDWPRSLGAAASTGRAPLGAAPASAAAAEGAAGRATATAADATPCDCATNIGAPPERRVAALWAITSFEIPAGAGELTVLDVRALYRDGIAIWLNGVEVARRALAPAPAATAFAERSHGPEWETFHVPVAAGLLRRGGNAVAVEVHAAAGASGPTLDLEIAGRRQPRIVRGPLLERVGRDRATIAFETDLAVRGAVEWGPTPALGQRAVAGILPGRRHEVELTGLTGGVVYYRLVAGGATDVRSFRTAPGPGEVVRIAAYGDVRGGHQVHAELVAAMLGETPDAVLCTGDLVLRGTDEGDWQRFFTVVRELIAEVPFYPAIGNHDVGRAGDRNRTAAELFALPATATGGRWYAVDIGDVHVAVLDSNAYEQRDQLAWLDADLGAARARGARALLVVTHDGPFARGIHGGNPIAARDYVPVMVRHRVALLLSGHDHLYQRGRAGGLDYVVTGGGGAALYPVTCGVAGRKACAADDGMIHIAREYHYLMLTVYPDWLEMCPRRADGTLVEGCVRYALTP